MRKFYFIRHGETHWNNEGKLQGVSDVQLNEKGKKQAEMTAIRMTAFDLNVIYSSKFLRAKLTAKKIAEAKGLAIIIIPELAEINFGNWEGASYPSLTEEERKEMNLWLQDPASFHPPGGEPFKVFQERVWDAFFKKIAKEKVQNTAIVTHAGVIKVIIAKILGLPPVSIKLFKISAASISLLELDDWGNFYVSLLNDTCHLEGI